MSDAEGALIAMHVDIALDPAVSERAAALATPAKTGESLDIEQCFALAKHEAGRVC